MKLLAKSDIFWKFYLPTDTLWLPKTDTQVLGYTTDINYIRTSFVIMMRYLFKVAYCLTYFTNQNLCYVT